MKVPRRAHGLVVAAVVLGLALPPVASAGMMGSEIASPKPASPEAEGKVGEAEAEAEAEATVEPEEDEPAQPQAGGDESSSEPPEGATSAGGDAAASEPAVEAAQPQGDESPVGEGEPGGAPEREVAEEPSVSGSEAEAVVTVRPGPVTSLSAEGEPPSDTLSREVVVDPRRRFSDRRIVFRASMLAFGVAGLALVPTVVGLHQRAYTGQVLDQLETPSEVGARPEVERYRRSMTTMALVSGAISGASLMAGAVLLGVGLRQRDAPPKATVAPAVGSGTAGVVVRGRF